MATNNATNKTADTFTATTSLATTFDTNVTSAGLTMSGTTISADGTDTNINVTVTPKGTGTLNPAAFSINSAYTFPTADGSTDYILKTDGAGTVAWSAGGGSGSAVQIVQSETGALVDCTTLIPFDDTIPQNTEGDEVLTATITPQNVNSTLLIIFNYCAQQTGAASAAAAAIFQDSTANAIAAGQTTGDSAGNAERGSGTLVYTMTAGTTSSTTFKARVGPAVNAQHIYINGAGAAREFGGTSSTVLIIIEFLP